MRSVPLFVTLLVVAAVGTMIALGVWQLQRAEWKNGLLATISSGSVQRAISAVAPIIPVVSFNSRVMIQSSSCGFVTLQRLNMDG